MVDKPCFLSYNKYRTVNIEKRITYKPKPKVNSKARESKSNFRKQKVSEKLRDKL